MAIFSEWENYENLVFDMMEQHLNEDSMQIMGRLKNLS